MALTYCNSTPTGYGDVTVRTWLDVFANWVHVPGSRYRFCVIKQCQKPSARCKRSGDSQKFNSGHKVFLAFTWIVCHMQCECCIDALRCRAWRLMMHPRLLSFEQNTSGCLRFLLALHEPSWRHVRGVWRIRSNVLRVVVDAGWLMKVGNNVLMVRSWSLTPSGRWSWNWPLLSASAQKTQLVSYRDKRRIHKSEQRHSWLVKCFITDPAYHSKVSSLFSCQS